MYMYIHTVKILKSHFLFRSCIIIHLMENIEMTTTYNVTPHVKTIIITLVSLKLDAS